MNVLVACEESQEVCKAFRAKGHRAFSCDIQECSGGTRNGISERMCWELLTQQIMGTITCRQYGFLPLMGNFMR